MGSKLHTRLRSRIEKGVRVVRRILRLHEPVELRVLRCLLAEDRVAQRRRLRLEVRRRVLLRLAVLNRDREHVLLRRRVELLALICVASIVSMERGLG